MHTFKNQQVINAPVMDHKGNRISLLPEIEREKSLEVDEFHVICLDIDFLMTVWCGRARRYKEELKNKKKKKTQEDYWGS